MTVLNTESVAAHEITRGDTILIEDDSILEVEWIGPDQFTDEWVEMIGPVISESGVDETEWDYGRRMPKDAIVTRIAKTAAYKHQMLETIDRAAREASKEANEKRRMERFAKRRKERTADPARNEPIAARLKALRDQIKDEMSDIAFDLNDDWPVMGLGEREAARNHIKSLTGDVDSLLIAARLWETRSR